MRRSLSRVVEVTRLLSNIVKYPFVNMQGKEARKVSYEKPGTFTPIEHTKKVVVRDAAEVEEELAKGLSIEEIFDIQKNVIKIGGDDPDADPDEDGFEAGLEATDLSEEFAELREEAESEAAGIVEAAREQADEIVIEARRQADDVRAQAHEEGFEAGREEGIQAGQGELDGLRAQIEEERQQLEGEYEQMVAGLEPQFVRVVCDLMEKLTGVAIDSEQELILHLIKTGLADVRKNAERIVIRVSPEDALTAETHKKELMESVADGVTVDIQTQDSMSKGECMIETDNQMLDAGIHTQLNNLLMAIRMLI